MSEVAGQEGGIDSFPDPGQDGRFVLKYMAERHGEVTNVELERQFSAMFSTVTRLIEDRFIMKDRTGYRFTERFRGVLEEQPNFLK